MSNFVLGIETSCDETGVAVYDITQRRILSNALFSQTELHKVYGGVVPEIGSRSQLEKIGVIVQEALDEAQVKLSDIGTIAVTHTPGLAGSLLIGLSFAKGLAWAENKKIIGINHLEGHIFSAFLKQDGSVEESIPFPHLALTASGGHTSMYLVEDFGTYTVLGKTVDDAAGEAFDKIAKILGYHYPGGATIEKLAAQVNFEDFFSYPRTKTKNQEIMFSFSGLKTAVLYDLVKKGAYDLNVGPIREALTPELQQKVASSLLVCITDIFEKNITLAFKKYPDIKALTFAGGVACNKYMKQRFADFCQKNNKLFFSPPPRFCTDNGGMIAFVGGYKATQGKFSDLSIDVGS